MNKEVQLIADCQAMPFGNTHVMPSCLTHGSLFSGIGGFDLAAHWMNWTNVFQCEKDEWCRKVLAKNFPNTKRFEDIKEFNAKEYNGTIDVISGGFPCQPFSVAGQRKGKDDDRYLWEEMLRVVREVAPSFVVGENVTGIISLALDTVLSDLEAQDYTTETFIIPACGKNAWHRRDRVWIVAYSNHGGNCGTSRKNESKGKKERLQKRNEMEQFGKSSDVWEQSIFPNTTTHGFQDWRSTAVVKPGQEQEPKRCSSLSSNTNNSNSEEQRKLFSNEKKFFASRCDSWWEAEPGMGRVVDGLPGRVDRLKGLGNAIVPQVAFELFKAVESVHRHGV